MKPLVNLAGAPFRNRRIFWIVLLAVVVVASSIGFRLVRSLTEIERQIGERQQPVLALEKRAKELEATAAGPQALTPEQRLTYWAANDLIGRKAFSWTHLLNDIERHIPATVRVLRIGVNKTAVTERAGSATPAKQTVALTMEVVAKSVPDVTLMLNEFNRTGIFVVTPKWQKPVEGLSDIEFGLEIEYQPPSSAPNRNLGQQSAGLN
jgi:hypothetical protein